MAGFAVFPCVENGKRPACEHGHRDATTDTAQIDAWWNENSKYNPAFSPGTAGWTVVDLDPGAAVTNPLPPTFTVKTPRGGTHLYYEGTLPQNTASKIGEHVDTRSIGGYVLLPTAYVIDTEKGIDGAYTVTEDRELSPLPQWIADAASRTHQHAKAATQSLDDPGNVARARVLISDNVRRGDVAVSGRGGNNRTYQLSCEVFNLGVTEQTTWELLREHWNPHCIPPWSDDELSTIVHNAANYAQNEAGAWAVAPAAEVFGAALDKLPEDVRQERRSRFYFEDESEQDNAPDPTWQIKDLIPDRATVLVVGAKGSFKSFIVTDIALAIAAGVETFGTKPARNGPTFYGAHEGRNDLKKARRRAWRLAREVDGPIDFFVAPGPRVANHLECEEFREQIRVRLRKSRTKIGMIVLDTVAKCMAGLDENNAKDVTVFTDYCESLRDEFECPVVAQHHLGKDHLRGSRGSSALPAGFDTVIEVKRVPGTKAVSVRVQNHRDAEERAQAWHFEGKAIAGSLVFSEATPAEFAEIETADDPFTAKKVGTALRRLNAVGKENSVTDQVLATELLPASEGKSVEEQQAATRTGARKLRGLAKTRLRGYVDGDLWFLPA